jgi:hypothetical protein
VLIPARDRDIVELSNSSDSNSEMDLVTLDSISEPRRSLPSAANIAEPQIAGIQYRVGVTEADAREGRGFEVTSDIVAMLFSRLERGQPPAPISIVWNAPHSNASLVSIGTNGAPSIRIPRIESSPHPSLNRPIPTTSHAPGSIASFPGPSSVPLASTFAKESDDELDGDMKAYLDRIGSNEKQQIQSILEAWPLNQTLYINRLVASEVEKVGAKFHPVVNLAKSKKRTAKWRSDAGITHRIDAKQLLTWGATLGWNVALGTIANQRTIWDKKARDTLDIITRFKSSVDSGILVLPEIQAAIRVDQPILDCLLHATMPQANALPGSRDDKLVRMTWADWKKLMEKWQRWA